MPDIKNRPSLLVSLFNRKNSELGKLCQHTVFLNELEKSLLRFLDAPLRAHCKIANYNNGTIVLHSDSPAWSAKLRYHTPALLDHLKTQCGLDSLKTIRIKVKPTVSKASSVKPRKLILSSSSSTLLRQVADATTDEDLRLSLLRIARHYHKTA